MGNIYLTAGCQEGYARDLGLEGRLAFTFALQPFADHPISRESEIPLKRALNEAGINGLVIGSQG